VFFSSSLRRFFLVDDENLGNRIQRDKFKDENFARPWKIVVMMKQKK
jgi:hypothetical protein